MFCLSISWKHLRVLRLVCTDSNRVVVLKKGMASNFEHVSVNIVDCPDLTKEPFHLACPGFGGSPKVVELGGAPYLMPTVNRDKVYDLQDLAAAINSEPCFVVGAGAGPWPYAGTNCEMVANVSIKAGEVRSETYIGKVKQPNDQLVVEKLPNSETRCAVLANLFFSEGKPGKVLEVIAKKRTGEDNFITSMRVALQKEYKEKPVGVGGVFLLRAGKAWQHVMQDFSATPLCNDDDLNKWLRFYNMSAPLIAVGTFVSSDPGLDLRVQHFHSFSQHGEAGHYHYDTTPETVEYLGYFMLGETVCRIDQPTETHDMGRD